MYYLIGYGELYMHYKFLVAFLSLVYGLSYAGGPGGSPNVLNEINVPQSIAETPIAVLLPNGVVSINMPLLYTKNKAGLTLGQKKIEVVTCCEDGKISCVLKNPIEMSSDEKVSVKLGDEFEQYCRLIQTLNKRNASESCIPISFDIGLILPPMGKKGHVFVKLVFPGRAIDKTDNTDLIDFASRCRSMGLVHDALQGKYTQIGYIEENKDGDYHYLFIAIHKALCQRGSVIHEHQSRAVIQCLDDQTCAKTSISDSDFMKMYSRFVPLQQNGAT